MLVFVQKSIQSNHGITFSLISNLATDYIQKTRGQALLSVAKFDIKVKVTTWIGHYTPTWKFDNPYCNSEE